MTEEAPPVERLRVPWGPPSAIGALVITFVIAVLGQSLLIGLARPFTRQHQLLASIVAYQFILAGVAVAVALVIVLPYRVGPPVLGFRFPGWAVLAMSAASVILIAVAIAGFESAFNALFPAFHLRGNAKELIPSNQRHLPAVEQVIVLIWAAVEAPLAEETLFRGVLYQGFRDFFVRGLPRWSAVLIAAFLSGTVFGLAHGQLHTLPILILLGVILAYVFELGRSLYASMVVHGIINAIAVLTLLHGS